MKWAVAVRRSYTREWGYLELKQNTKQPLLSSLLHTSIDRIHTICLSHVSIKVLASKECKHLPQRPSSEKPMQALALSM